MKLSDIAPGQALSGLDPDKVCTVVAAARISEGAVQVVYRLPDGSFRERLIATDAAGEGVNLQCAHLMVNYDLPWNPNRLEQRFGRIHRIGQTEVCHLWSLVAKETWRPIGDVPPRLTGGTCVPYGLSPWDELFSPFNWLP